MDMKHSRRGENALAWLVVAGLAAIAILTIVPAFKSTALQIIGAVTGHSTG